MAIQIPNPGTGNGATGDNEFVLWSKVKDNFSNTAHAASKMIGTGAEQVPLSKNVPSLLGTLATKDVGGGTGQVSLNKDIGKVFAEMSYTSELVIEDLDNPEFGMRRWSVDRAEGGTPIELDWGPYAYIQTLKTSSSAGFAVQLALPYGSSIKKMHGLAVRSQSAGTWNQWYVMWHSRNTTKDSNGFIKAASPIVKVFADKVELNDDAVNQNVTYKKNGVGDYTITTVSGLSTDGWYIELPKDINGNPKVAVTLSEVDGAISLKSYKRIFSMETFTFEPDLDNPLDIPDTRWIDLRLNEIPVETTDEIQPEEVDLDK